MFELNFRGERYLPFEGAGAISRWRFELPAEFRAVDYNTISDLVLQIRYTADGGGSVLKTDASRRVRKAMRKQNAQITAAGEKGRLIRAFSLPHDFAAEWANLAGSPPAPKTISIGVDRVPFLASDRTIETWKMSRYLRSHSIETASGTPLTVHAPRAAYTRRDKPQPAIPGESPDVSDCAELYEFNLVKGDWTPVTITAGKAAAWRLELPKPAPALSDAVLALGWPLTSQRDRP